MRAGAVGWPFIAQAGTSRTAASRPVEDGSDAGHPDNCGVTAPVGAVADITQV